MWRRTWNNWASEIEHRTRRSYSNLSRGHIGVGNSWQINWTISYCHENSIIAEGEISWNEARSVSEQSSIFDNLLIIRTSFRIPKSIGEWSAEQFQKVQVIQPENHNLPKEKSLNDKQLLIGLKSEPHRQTSDDLGEGTKKLIETIQALITQPINHSLETELQQRAEKIGVSFIFKFYFVTINNKRKLIFQTNQQTQINKPKKNLFFSLEYCLSFSVSFKIERLRKHKINFSIFGYIENSIL